MRHSLIYIATDFGRTKTRSRGSLSFGIGPDLDNGSVMISPLLQGKSIYGVVDHVTAQPYSHNLTAGLPDPNLGVSTLGRNQSLVMREGHGYSLSCHSLGIDFPGRIDMSGLVRSSAENTCTSRLSPRASPTHHQY